jgi:hypothetical protein
MALKNVIQAPRSRHQDVEAPAKLKGLISDREATDKKKRQKAQRAAQLVDNARYLAGQFVRRDEDSGQWARGRIELELLQMAHNADDERNHVSEGLTGARLGQAHDVDAVQRDRDALGLNGKGSSVAVPGKDFAKGTRKRVVPVEKRRGIDAVAREDRDVVVGPPDSSAAANLRRGLRER